jgi:hypothetical protein
MSQIPRHTCPTHTSLTHVNAEFEPFSKKYGVVRLLQVYPHQEAAP